MLDWPNIKESYCPWCERVINAPVLTRQHDDGNEYQCPDCGKRHVRRKDDEEFVYYFFPGDVLAMESHEVKPLPFRCFRG
jgi:NAD-dependent SIR2 family protein deacetylase